MSIRKYIIAAAAAVLTLLPVRAQSSSAGAAAADSTVTIVDEINAGGNIVVELQPGLETILQLPREESSNPVADSADGSQPERHQKPNAQGKIVGYRVQIYADNNARVAKAEVRKREREVAHAVPYKTYVTYSSPYWRLRVGDFRTQEEAQSAATQIRQRFPRYAREVRVVRDHVYAR